MRTSLPTVLAAISVLGLLVYLRVGADDPAVRTAGDSWDDPGPHQEAAGSRVACAVPLSWRVGSVHPAFGLTEQEVRDAVAAAAFLWNDAVGRTLFRFDPAEGFPIRLMHDDRQERANERRRAEAELARSEAELESWRRQLERMSENLRDTRERHAAEVAEFDRRLSEHNETVREWNESGDAPAEVVSDLRNAERSLEARRRELRERAAALEAEAGRFNEEQARFNRAVDAFNRTSAEMERRFPPERVESGIYRETVETVAGRVRAVAREIVIYRFDERPDLVRVLAHELGHALGLGHASAAGAIMSDEYEEASGPPRIHPSDLELLRDRCPDL